MQDELLDGECPLYFIVLYNMSSKRSPHRLVMVLPL